MKVIAKFVCEYVEDNDPDGKNIKLRVVTSGSDENKEFFKWTPTGEVTLGCVNPEAHKIFIPGKEYYVEFELAEEVENKATTFDEGTPKVPGKP